MKAVTTLVLALTAAVALAAEPKSPGEKPSKEKASKEQIARFRAVKKVDSQLRRVPAARGQRKSASDFFVIGKVELALKDRSAQVAFAVLKGRKDAAEKIVDYVAGSPSQTVRNWRPVARFADKEAAQAGVAAVRKRYDELQAYRAQLMKAYQAASMCRT